SDLRCHKRHGDLSQRLGSLCDVRTCFYAASYPPILAMRWGMAMRKPTRPTKVAPIAQTATMTKAGRRVNDWAVRASRAVVMSGETGFHVASRPASPSVRAG